MTRSRDSADGFAAVAGGGPGESPGFLLWRVTLRWQRALAAVLRPLGLTHVQFVLLASTWWMTEVAGEPRPTQRRLAEHAVTDPMMTSQVLRALESAGLIVRTPDPTDSRARLLAVTPTGAALAQRAIALVEAADADFFAAFPDRPALLATLHALSG